MATAVSRTEPPSREEAGPRLAPARRRSRDPYIDNAKFLLMVLVVLGHVFRHMFDVGSFYRPAYLWIYLFHMPMFVLVSGYLSKGSMLDARRVERAVRTLFIPYVIFEIVNTWFFYELFDRSDFRLTLLDPSWRMWFILWLFLWRMLLPYFLQLRAPLLAAIAVSILAGYAPDIGGFLSLSRTLGMLPFFILGHKLQAGDFARLRGWWVRGLAAAVLVATYVVLSRWDGFRLAWTYWKDPYVALGWEGWTAGWTRMAIGLGALVVGMAFLAIVPASWNRLTSLGTRTMYAYILHGFLVQWAKVHGLLDVSGFWPQFGIIVVSLIGTAIISSKVVADLTRPLFEPPLDWMFRRRPQAVEQPAPA